MNEILKLKIFIDDLRMNRDIENLSYTSFYNLDLFHNNKGISFFRCDFRGSKFSNCKFYKNNFDRSDFISCVFQGIFFNKVQFAACEIKNCFFENVRFESGNYYNNTSIQECTFENCFFESQKFLVNMKNCKFINCIFSDCTFERSTTEKITFESCEINNTDLATMHAERHIFYDCILINVYIGIDYIFGYLFCNTSIEDMIVLYHGEKLCLDNENNFGQYIKELWIQQRYYEFINSNVIYKNFKILPQVLYKALLQSKNKTASIRRLDILDIFDCIIFYTKNCIIPYDCFVEIYNIILSFKWDVFPAEEFYAYKLKCQELEMIINNAEFTEEFINSARGTKSIISFRCRTDDFEKAYNITEELLNKIYDSFDLDREFILIDKKKGSWILTFAVCSMVALIIPKIIKSYADIVIEIKTKEKISKQLEKQLDKKCLKINDLKTVSEIATQTGIVKIEDNNFEKINLPQLIDSIKIGL